MQTIRFVMAVTAVAALMAASPASGALITPAGNVLDDLADSNVLGGTLVLDGEWTLDTANQVLRRSTNAVDHQRVRTPGGDDNVNDGSSWSGDLLDLHAYTAFTFTITNIGSTSLQFNSTASSENYFFITFPRYSSGTTTNNVRYYLYQLVAAANGGSTILTAGQSVTVTAGFDDYSYNDRPIGLDQGGSGDKAGWDAATNTRYLAGWGIHMRYSDRSGVAPIELSEFNLVPAVVPEPTTLGLLAVGGLALGGLTLRRRRRA